MQDSDATIRSESPYNRDSSERSIRSWKRGWRTLPEEVMAVLLDDEAEATELEMEAVSRIMRLSRIRVKATRS